MILRRLARAAAPGECFTTSSDFGVMTTVAWKGELPLLSEEQTF
jgi:hypothetical protein